MLACAPRLMLVRGRLLVSAVAVLCSQAAFAKPRMDKSPTVKVAIQRLSPEDGELEELLRELLARSGMVMASAPAAADVADFHLTIAWLATDRVRLTVARGRGHEEVSIVRELDVPTSSVAARLEAVAQAAESSLRAYIDEDGSNNPDAHNAGKDLSITTAPLRDRPAAQAAPSRRQRHVMAGLFVAARWMDPSNQGGAVALTPLGIGLRGRVADHLPWHGWFTIAFTFPRTDEADATKLGIAAALIRIGGSVHKQLGRLTGAVDLGFGSDVVRAISSVSRSLSSEMLERYDVGRHVITTGQLSVLLFIPMGYASLLLGVGLEVSASGSISAFQDAASVSPAYRWSSYRPTLITGAYF